MILDKNKKIILRILTALLMFCLIMWGYWWFVWCIAIALLFYFPKYYEIILWGILYDALYSLSLEGFGGFRYVFTITSIILFAIAFFLRKRLIIYDNKD